MRKFLAAAVLALPFMLAGCAHHTVVYGAPPPPPAAYSEAARQGYHDGAEAARRDISEGRRPDAGRHPRFRNPPVPPPLMNDYRHGFRDGYARAFGGGY